jgi:sortase A
MPDTAPRLRKWLTGVSIVAALVGVGLIAYPFITDLWASRIQSGLSGDLAQSADKYQARKIKSGEALTRLEIPKLGVDVVVVQGVSLEALRAGAGHYPDTPLPGEPGNVGIAGHRTTYGRPFNRIDELAPGDKVILTTPIARHVYEIARPPWVVPNVDWSVIDNFPNSGSWLTLTTCHPEGSDDYRIVARGRLVRSSDLVAQAAGESQ